MKRQITFVVVLLMGFDICWASLDYDGHGNWNPHISFGEISLEKIDQPLPAITLDHAEDEIAIENWPRPSIELQEISIPSWDYKIQLPRKNRDRVIPVVEEIGTPIVDEDIINAY